MKYNDIKKKIQKLNDTYTGKWICFRDRFGKIESITQHKKWADRFNVNVAWDNLNDTWFGSFTLKEFLGFIIFDSVHKEFREFALLVDPDTFSFPPISGEWFDRF